MTDPGRPPAEETGGERTLSPEPAGRAARPHTLGEFDLQELVVSSQRARLSRLSDLSAIVFAGPGGDPLKSRRPDLEIFRARVLDEIGALHVHRSLVNQLLAAYREIGPGEVVAEPAGR